MDPRATPHELPDHEVTAMYRHATCLLLPLFCLLATGCVDIGMSTSSGDGDAETTLDDSVARATTDYVVLDLTTGETEPRRSVDFSDSRYRDTHMVFSSIRSDGADYLIGCFEVTQAQWERLGGDTPWTVYSSSLVGSDAVAGDKPAFGLAYSDITPVLASYGSARGVDLGVPSGSQWSEACGTSTYAWGSSTARSTVEDHAVVNETLDGVIGPRRVGDRSANDNNCYDMHGNVWEWTSPGSAVRGGSWYDPVTRARRDNSVGEDAGITSASNHMLFGVRLVLRQ